MISYISTLNQHFIKYLFCLSTVYIIWLIIIHSRNSAKQNIIFINIMYMYIWCISIYYKAYFIINKFLLILNVLYIYISKIDQKKNTIEKISLITWISKIRMKSTFIRTSFLSNPFSSNFSYWVSQNVPQICTASA